MNKNNINIWYNYILIIGPLKDTGVIPISYIMLIIDEQSTGKSTFMKILSFCRWIEKAMGESIELKYAQSLQQLLYYNHIQKP